MRLYISINRNNTRDCSINSGSRKSLFNMTAITLTDIFDSIQLRGVVHLDDDDDDVYFKKITRVPQNLVLHRNADQAKA
jgi:hypothetical protein